MLGKNKMLSASRNLIKQRWVIVGVIAVLLVVCAGLLTITKINYDITKYLPEDAHTKLALDVMEKEFGNNGMATVMVKGLGSVDEANAIVDEILEIDGVKMVNFSGKEDTFRDGAALITVILEENDSAEKSTTAVRTIMTMLEDQEAYMIGQTVNNVKTQDVLNGEMMYIMIVAVSIILIVLLLTSRSFMDIPIFIIVFGVAALLNMGTNFIMGEVSYITNSIAIIFQLVLTIDYAIILSQRYMNELQERNNRRDAIIYALADAVPEILSSSMTTFTSFIALMFMQLSIGFDMGMVLAKGVMISCITVFTLMPALIFVFGKAIDKTKHRQFIPSFKGTARGILKARKVLVPIFCILLIAGAVVQSFNSYTYATYGSTVGGQDNDVTYADKQITAIFGKQHMLAVLVPKNEYDKQLAFLEEYGEKEHVTAAIGMANTEIADGLTLTGELTPEMIADISGGMISESRAEDMLSLLKLKMMMDGAYVSDNLRIIEVADWLVSMSDEEMQELIDMIKGALGDMAGDIDRITDSLDGVLDMAREQLGMLNSENYTRLVFNLDLPMESEETFAFIETMRSELGEYFDDFYMLGESVGYYDMSLFFKTDNMLISILIIAFILAILLATFKNWLLPIILTLVIQGSIWMNFSVPFMLGDPISFIGYLVVSAVQMGATIDYAIVITNRYMNLRATMSKKDAICEALSMSMATVLTSGSILAATGFAIGIVCTDPVTRAMGMLLGRGTCISMVAVVFALPGLLYMFDNIINKANFSKNRRISEPPAFPSDTERLLTVIDVGDNDENKRLA